MTIQITEDVRIRRETQNKRKRYIYDFWTVEVYDYGCGWRQRGPVRYSSQYEAETAARYYGNQW